MVIRDRVEVERDGERIEVFNQVNVRYSETATVQSYNPVYEQHEKSIEIGAGDSSMTPEAVSVDVAHMVEDEFGVRIDTMEDIEVVDLDAMGVDVL